MKKKLVLIAALFLMGLLAFSASCTQEQTQMLQGILQNIDSANGEITITTTDGKTVKLDIRTDTTVETDGKASSLAGLANGNSVEVEVDKDGRAAKSVHAWRAEIHGTIVSTGDNQLTVNTKNGDVTVKIDINTKIEADDSRGSVNDLTAGQKVEVKYNPDTKVALKIELEDEDEKDDDEEEDRNKSSSSLNWGILEIRASDPPPANVKSAVVHLTNLEVHRVTGGSDNSDGAGEWIPILDAPPSFDLLDVIGVEQLLGSANITAGRFTQIRMDVSEVTGETADGEVYSAEVPGDKLKITRPFNVGNGRVTVLVLDFDGEKSLVRRGNGSFMFKPVVKLLISEKEKPEAEKSGSHKADDEENENGPHETEISGTIESIAGTTWQVTTANGTVTVNVSQAEIEGEPAEGAEVEIKGTLSGETFLASEVEIKEPDNAGGSDNQSAGE